MPIRQELGCKTIFNILGPLTNPAGVKRQLSGAFAPDLLFPMAETLDTLGCEKAWLVHGSDGTDELTIIGVSTVVELLMGKLVHSRFTQKMQVYLLINYQKYLAGLRQKMHLN